MCDRYAFYASEETPGCDRFPGLEDCQAYYCTSADGGLLTMAGVFDDGGAPDKALTFAVVVTDSGAGGQRGRPKQTRALQPAWNTG